jgi:Ser/Thr protein kinase RdoA (MazF antagonist)
MASSPVTDRTRSPAGGGGGGRPPLRRLLAEFGLERFAGKDHLTGLRGGRDWIAARLSPPGGTPVELRGALADAPVPGQFAACGKTSMGAWAESRMATLRCLRQAGYPAPEPVPAAGGALTAHADGWCLRVMTHGAGPVTEPTSGELRLTGAALGRLHSLPVLPGAGRSYWHAPLAVPATLRRLAETGPHLPGGWREPHAAFTAAARAMEDGERGLPEVLIHGDVWAENCVRTAPGEVTFIDWDTGGLGLAVLDLGRALLECQIDSGLPPGQPDAWLITPDEHKITSLAEGYRDVRPVGPAELRLLPHAIRFGIALVGAVHFRQALLEGHAGPGMDARLARLRNRLAASEEIAEIAAGTLSAG